MYRNRQPLDVRVKLFGRHRKRIFVINGEPYLTKEAAELLGMKQRTLEKRVERGTDLFKPVKRYVYE